MPAVRDGNLRSGDLNEDLGILLLKQFAAVAPVPRTEDVGLDAICTLLQPDETSPRIRLAKESFAIQLKSSSVRELRFNLLETQWMLALELPFFLGLVDPLEASLRVYTLNHLLRKLHLTSPAKYLEGIAVVFDKNREDTNTQRIWLGEPILNWSIANAKSICPGLIPIMQSWCQIELINSRLRKLDAGYWYDWKTNQMPVHAGGTYSNKELTRAIESMEEPLYIIALDVVSRGDCNAWAYVRHMLAFLDANMKMREPIGYWDKMAQKNGLQPEQPDSTTRSGK